MKIRAITVENISRYLDEGRIVIYSDGENRSGNIDVQYLTNNFKGVRKTASAAFEYLELLTEKERKKDQEHHKNRIPFGLYGKDVDIVFPADVEKNVKVAEAA
jgi:hypothetical protein